MTVTGDKWQPWQLLATSDNHDSYWRWQQLARIVSVIRNITKFYCNHLISLICTTSIIVFLSRPQFKAVFVKFFISRITSRMKTPYSRGTVVSIVSCRCTYCFRETTHGKITRHYSRFCAMAFCYVHKCELSYIYPGDDIKLHPHRVKLYRIWCVGSG